MSEAGSPQVSRGLLVTLGIVVGFAVLAAMYMFVVQPLLLDGAQEFAEDAPVSATPAMNDTAQLAQVDDEEEEDDPLPETTDVFSARDPFQQLVTAPAPTGTGGTDPTTDTDTTTGTPTTGTPTTGTPSTGTPSTGTPTTGTPSATVGKTAVRLVDVFTAQDGSLRINVTVNGTAYEAGVNETFAQRFRVLDISGQCATLLFGDSRFTLCAGEEIRK